MASDRIQLPLASESAVRHLLASLSLPIPNSVEPLDSSKGAYHKIYILSFGDNDTTSKLILRISAGELPHTKTMNEIAMIKWVRENTTIPAPAVIAFDHTQNNALDNEYSITEYVTDKPLSEVYTQVKDSYALVNQLIDYLVQLYAKPFHHVGGLQITKNAFTSGPMTEWHFWSINDTQFWPEPLLMNAVGPFDNYQAYCIENIKLSKKAIDMHDSLKGLRTLRLDQFIEAIASKEKDISSSRYVLAHRDLHFGNIMYDVDQQKITGIIDWELAAILPYQLWNPGNFLWTGNEGKEADEEKANYNAIFERLCHDRQLEYLIDTSFVSKDQEMMQQATTLLRRLINAYLRGWQRNCADQLEDELRSIFDTFI